MNAGLRGRFGPIARLSLGLVALFLSLALLADMMLGVVPGRDETQRQVRKRVAENLALQITVLAEAGDMLMLGKTIQLVLARGPEIGSIAVRSTDGSLYLQRGLAHAVEALHGSAASTANRLRVPIFAGTQRWGEVEVQFVASQPATLLASLAQPTVQLMLVLGIGGFLLCYVYLRRAMQYLNPSASVPDRVRKAFDSLAEGLLIIDQQGRVVLANKAFRQLHPHADGELNGKRIDALNWLSDVAARDCVGPAPWTTTLQSGTSVAAQPLELIRPDGGTTRLLVSSNAITDAKGRVRGSLITFDNVTAVHSANEQLRSAVAQLESSRQRIEEQNEELRRLASRDSMTGCFNRRVFFELAHDLFMPAQRDQTRLSCLMIDIDHFKQFNDVYGHAVGDQVIQIVARTLSKGLRLGDVLGRYGGEEFCIVLSGAGAQDAMAVAERIRADIEANASRSIRSIEVMTITASFGVATLNPATRTIEALIDQADRALYKSKQAGRNRVTLWEAST